MESKVIICSHVQDINGTQQSAILRKFELNLENFDKEYVTLSHSMNIPQKSFFYNSQTKKTSRVWLKVKFSILRYLYEIILNLIYIKRLSINWESTYIWLDPLNSLSWVIAKKLWYIKKNIFYTPDYSPQKFKNKILNKIYHWIDNYCVKNADEIWNVSSKITEIRNKQLKDWSKNYFLPNVPWKINTKENKKDKLSLITSWTLNIHLEYKNLITSILIIAKKKPDIKLYIAWEWPLRWEIEKYIKDKKAEKYVILLGFLDIQSYLQKVSECWIGLAMYNWKWWFNYYWDSTKCREFMYFWLPILTTSFHSTADEILSNQAWIIDDIMSIESYTENINSLINHYDNYSSNSEKLGKINNKIYTNIIWNL